MKQTYEISIKRGTRYSFSTRTFNNELHFSRWYDKMSASGVKIIDTFLIK